MIKLKKIPPYEDESTKVLYFDRAIAKITKNLPKADTELIEGENSPQMRHINYILPFSSQLHWRYNNKFENGKS